MLSFIALSILFDLQNKIKEFYFSQTITKVIFYQIFIEHR